MKARTIADLPPGAQGAPTRALAIHLGALGDLVLALPALAGLAADRPLELRGPSLERLSIARAPRGPAATTRLLGHELFRDLEPGEPDELASYSPVVAFCADDGGPLVRRVRAVGGAVAPPRPSAGAHATDQVLGPLVAAGLVRAGASREPAIRPAPEDIEAARAIAPPGGFVVVQPGAGGRGKRWAPGAFAQALGPVRARGLAVVVVLGPAELDPPEPALRLAGVADRVVLAPPIGTLVGLLALARGYLGNDAGVTHVAAALGTPTVAVFGPTDPRSWAPRGRRVTVVTAPGGDLAALGPEVVTRGLLRRLEAPVDPDTP